MSRSTCHKIELSRAAEVETSIFKSELRIRAESCPVTDTMSILENIIQVINIWLGIPLTPGLSRASWTQWISLYEVSWCVCMLNPKCHSQMMMDRSLLHVNLKLVTVSIAQRVVCALRILTMIRYDQRQKAHHLGHNLGQTMLGLSRFRLNSQQHFYFLGFKTTLPQCKSQWKPISHMSHFKHIFSSR